jgi:polysaccharide biosynthesis protein PslJ
MMHPSMAQSGMVPARRRKLTLPAGWPIYALFLGFPLWWVLGLGSFIWPILAMPMLLSLLRQRNVRMPPRFGWWLMFLGWLVIAGTQLESMNRLPAYLYRGSAYFSITVLFLYVYNAPRERVPSKKIVMALALFWMFVVFGGFLGTFFPEGGFRTVLARVIPAGIGDESLRAVLNPTFANRGVESKILGYGVGRPSAPFAYTNAWGANFALLVPFVFMSWSFVKRTSWRLLTLVALGASLLPVISSLNRGLWISLGLGLVYAAGLYALHGKAKAFMAVMAGLLLVVGLSLFVPRLNKLVNDRILHGHSNEGRKGLYTEAIERVGEKPLLGYGTPITSIVDPTKPSVGTHGQFWLVLVTTGIPGTVFFLGWYGLTLLRTRKGAPGFGPWCHVVVFISFIQLAFYEQLPTQLHITVIAAALALRELRPPPRRPVAVVAAAEPRIVIGAQGPVGVA